MAAVVEPVKELYDNHKGNKTLRTSKWATFERILFSISRIQFENDFPEIIQKKENVTIKIDKVWLLKMRVLT